LTVQEIIDRAKDDFDQTGDGTFSDTQLLAIFNEGYTDLCRNTEMLDKQSEVTMSALDGVLTIPSDFLHARQTRWSYNTQLYAKSHRILDYDQRDWKNEVGTPEYSVYFNFDQMRLKPINSAAGTVTFRYTYIPADLTVSDSPAIPLVYQEALVDFIVAQMFVIVKEYNNANAYWGNYLKRRARAKRQSRDGQRTPDTLTTQRPVNVFSYPKWDQGYRTK